MGVKDGYWLDYDDDEYAEEYMPVLKGPDGFEAMLGEPEDCSWLRDGAGVVDRLNEQHKEIEALRAQLKE